jgi:hypothetical protein
LAFCFSLSAFRIATHRTEVSGRNNFVLPPRTVVRCTLFLGIGALHQAIVWLRLHRSLCKGSTMSDVRLGGLSRPLSKAALARWPRKLAANSLNLPLGNVLRDPIVISYSFF